MYTSMAGLAAFLGRQGGSKTARGIMWFGVGAVIGWPFAGALVLPLLLDEIVLGARTGEVASTIARVIDGAARCLAVLVRYLPFDFAVVYYLLIPSRASKSQSTAFSTAS